MYIYQWKFKLPHLVSWFESCVTKCAFREKLSNFQRVNEPNFTLSRLTLILKEKATIDSPNDTLWCRSRRCLWVFTKFWVCLASIQFVFTFTCSNLTDSVGFEQVKVKCSNKKLTFSFRISIESSSKGKKSQKIFFSSFLFLLKWVLFINLFFYFGFEWNGRIKKKKNG